MRIPCIIRTASNPNLKVKEWILQLRKQISSKPELIPRKERPNGIRNSEWSRIRRQNLF